MELRKKIRQDGLQYGGGELAHRLQDALTNVLLLLPKPAQPQGLCLVVADPDKGLERAGPHRPFGVIHGHVGEGVQHALASDLAQDLANSHTYLQVREREGLNEGLDDAGPGDLPQE